MDQISSCLIIINLSTQERMARKGSKKARRSYELSDSEISEVSQDESIYGRKKKYFKWTKGENEEYARFLALNESEFENSNGRRSLRFFNMMA